MGSPLLNFPSRGRYSCRELAAYESATVAGGRMVCITPQQGQKNPARISFIARHPRSIVIRGSNDNRFIISHPPFVASRRELAPEAGAYCCRLEGLFLDFGALSRVVNFVRALVPGNLFLSALKPSKQSARCLSKSFEVLLSVLRHENHHGRRNGQGVVKA